MFESSPHRIASYYAASCGEAPQRRALDQSLEADVVVVGAGYTGLYTALRLAEAGRRVVVLEASRVAWAASGRNGGQVILGFSCDMPPFESALGQEGARTVWNLTREAAAEIRRRIAENAIDCDFASGHVWTSVLQRRVHLLHEWQETAAQRLGYHDLHFIERNDLDRYVGSARYQAGLLDTGGGHLHPLKYALGLARAAEVQGVRIFEQSRALRVEEGTDRVTVHTAQCQVRAGRLVLACNSYIDALRPTLARRVLPVGTYMIATEPLDERLANALLPGNHAVSDNQFILDYFRLSADRRLLLVASAPIQAAHRPT